MMAQFIFTADQKSPQMTVTGQGFLRLVLLTRSSALPGILGWGLDQGVFAWSPATDTDLIRP